MSGRRAGVLSVPPEAETGTSGSPLLSKGAPPRICVSERSGLEPVRGRGRQVALVIQSAVPCFTDVDGAG